MAKYDTEEYEIPQGEREVGGKVGSKGYDFGPSLGPTVTPKASPLRGWEFKFATGEFFGKKKEGGGFFETIYEPTEMRDFSANVYGAVRTGAEILPYTRYLFPSGRDEWARKSTTGQTIELGIEALSLLPPFLIGKGLAVVAKAPVKAGTFPFRVAKKFALKKRVARLTEESPFLDGALGGIPKYERISPAAKAVKKWGLSEEEALSLVKEKPWVWSPSGRSGGFWESKGSEGFQKLFKKDGFLKDKVRKQLERWKRPHDVQEVGHYTAEWNKQLSKIFGEKYSPDAVFRMQSVKLFGEEIGKGLKYGDVDANTMGWMLRDLIEETPAKLMKHMDIGYGHVQPYHTLPSRKVFGFGNRVWGTYDKVYLPIREMFGSANKYATLMTNRFHSLLASRGLGSLVGKGEGVLGLKKNFTKREWEEAGKLVTDLDDAIGKGLRQEEVQQLMEGASVKAQKIAKSWHDFTDSLYSDYMKKKIPQVFEEIGLTKRGKDGLEVLMGSPNGIARYIDVAFSQSANLAYADKAKIVESMLKKARGVFKASNIDWFASKPVKVMAAKEKKELLERISKGLEELSPMKKGGKKGFVGYVENYATRIRDKQFAQSSDRFQKLAKKRKAGFTKGRIREVSEEGRLRDLTRIAEARINMQAKELYVYKQLEKVISHAETLPEKFRNYSEHYIARQLGEASNADVALAQWLTGTVGRITGRIYDERSAAHLAHTINDLIYMGGLGFKPFSAMRNYFQPLLMVPADMGGVKDMYWLGKGYTSAFKKETRDYIKSIGAIQEFAPDLYLRPRVAGFGGSFTVGGKKFDLPSTQTMRDLALWMFKNSDRHNRYVTGGAAIEKWDYFSAKYLKGGLDAREMKLFKKKLNINSREEWVRAQMNEHLRKGTLEGLEEAKKLWVYDVIADTQYLYGTLDAPIYGQSAGSLGKMAGIFQSWWMNYGAALEKWALRTPGSAPIVNGRMMEWLLVHAITEKCTERLWGQSTASKMVHLGPFPTRVSEFMIPPSFAPIYYSARVLADGLDAIKYQDPTKFKRSVKALGRSSMMFVPGGLQIGQLYRGAREEGFPGFLKGIVRYDPVKEKGEY